MANFTTANLVKAQARLAAKFNEAEMRKKQSPALTLAMQNLNAVVPGHEELRKREDRPIEANILKRSKRATTASRTHNHTGNRGDSFTLGLNFSIFTDTFSMSVKMLDNSVFTFEEVLAQQLLNASMNIHEAIETFLKDYLVTNRSQSNAATVGGTFSAANDAFQIAAADKARFYQIAKSMMRANQYQGIYDVLASSLTYLDAEHNANQGAGNSTNLGYQFNGLNIVECASLTDANYAAGCSLIMPAGSFGVLPWIPKQNRTGRGDYNSTLGGYGSIADPLGSGIPFALHAYTERADTSAANGNTQDDLIQFEISLDLAPILPPLSTAGESVVYEVAQLS